MMLVCVLIVATFRECLVFLVLLGLVVRMACLVNYLAPNRIVGVQMILFLSWESGVGMSAACSPWTSPEVVVRVWEPGAARSADMSTSPKRLELTVLIGLRCSLKAAQSMMNSQCNNRNIEYWVHLLELVKIHVLVFIFLYKIYWFFCR